MNLSNISNRVIRFSNYFFIFLATFVGSQFVVALAASQSLSPIRVLVFGDSIAAAYGLDPADSFPAVLQKMADDESKEITVINAGLSGETTAGGARRINWVLKQKIDILLIELGGNDALRGLDLKQTEANLVSIIKAAREKYPEVHILLGGMQAPPNLGSDFSEKFRAIYPRIALEQSVELIPFILEGVAGVAELNQNDGIHPTAEGQKIIANLVWPYLKRGIEKISKNISN